MPAIAETVRVQVTIAPGAATGDRELRLVTPNGMTNPLEFCVGQLPEWSRGLRRRPRAIAQAERRRATGAARGADGAADRGHAAGDR